MVPHDQEDRDEGDQNALETSNVGQEIEGGVDRAIVLRQVKVHLDGHGDLGIVGFLV